jgi:signal transduction histidine kinase
VRGDPGLIVQALRNLIATGMKYSPDGERVDVTLSHDADAAQVTVRDRGPGIPADAGRDAFDLFHRSPQVAAQVYGTGLGLYVARALIEAQDGTVWLRGRQGGGTEVGFTLPLYREEAA